MSNQNSRTRSKIIETVWDQVSPATPASIVALIAKQLERASDADARIKEEGQVVRDMRGSVVPHPSIQIEIAATKVAADLLAKHASGRPRRR